MNGHEKINYVELPANNIPASRAFFTKAPGWTFEDYGLECTSFSDQGFHFIEPSGHEFAVWSDVHV